MREKLKQHLRQNWKYYISPTLLVCLLLGGLLAALMAYLIGLPVLRLKSDYLAIATLGFAEILRAIFQWQTLGPITNGANMIKSFPTFSDFNIKDAGGQVILRLSTFVPFLFAIICIAIIVLLIHSSYGRAFKAIRDDEVAAEGEVAEGIDDLAVLIVDAAQGVDADAAHGVVHGGHASAGIEGSGIDGSAEQGAAGVDQILAAIVHRLINQKILLLGADGGFDTDNIFVTEKPENSQGLFVYSLH